MDATAEALYTARALVLHDLVARGHDSARVVDLLENAVSSRRWWVEQWPDGAEFVAGQLAQDVQDQLLDDLVRWPRCTACDQLDVHELHIVPDLGPDPHWVCDKAGIQVAALGDL